MSRTRVREFLESTNRAYVRLHTAKEDAFWIAKMGLADDAAHAQRECDEREIAWSRFLQDPQNLSQARAALAEARAQVDADPEQIRALRGWEHTFGCHAIESAAARALAADLVELEGRLELARARMPLGYRDRDGRRVSASSVKLAMMLRSEPEEGLRRAAWEGLRSIERFVLEGGFLELIAKRNRLGREAGAEDYYDWKSRRVEGLSKAEIFARLDELEERTRASAAVALSELAARRSAAALAPWNLLWNVSGDSTRETDPYFPFRSALERWGRSFCALGVRYAGATLVLDLVDRPGKYENGFMHGPVVRWRDGARLLPARIHFTANAIPGMVGSGQRAMTTLFHEGGHAAHFANIDMPAPCFGQEFAPTSVGFSETQSMFLDSLLSDADWKRRYALDRVGQPLPLELIEKETRATRPFAAWSARQMLSVCYGEKALYEIPERELTPERVLDELRAVERRLCMLDQGSPRPVLAVPHLISGDASAYYHGYVLAEMAVHQTRAHFLERDGHLVDNPRLGDDLARNYWQPGNSRSFDEFLVAMTGRPLSAQAMAEELNLGVEPALARDRARVAALAQLPAFDGPIELDAHVRVIHGRQDIADSTDGFDVACRRFATWVDGMCP